MSAVNKEEQVSQLHAEARKAWHQRDHEKAIELFQKLASVDEDNPLVHVNLARAYGLNFQYEESARTTQEIAKRFGDLAHVHFTLGESDLRYTHIESAEQHFLSAIRLGLDPKA